MSTFPWSPPDSSLDDLLSAHARVTRLKVEPVAHMAAAYIALVDKIKDGGPSSTHVREALRHMIAARQAALAYALARMVPHGAEVAP